MRKYQKGEPIKSVADFERSENQWFIVRYGTTEKTTHRGWVISWQYRMLEKLIKDGRLFEAREVNHG